MLSIPRYFRAHAADRSHRHDLHLNTHERHSDVGGDLAKVRAFLLGVVTQASFMNHEASGSRQIRIDALIDRVSIRVFILCV